MTTIHITNHQASFKIHHKYFKVFHQQQQLTSIPIRNISQFIIFGNIKLPKEVIQVVRLERIPVLYLTETGEYSGRLENPSPTQTKYLNYQQKRLRDREFNLAIAQSIIWAKLHNQHTFLQSWSRYQANQIIQRSLNYLTLLMDNLSAAPSIEDLQGYIEEADNVYRSAITSLLSFYEPFPAAEAKQISKFFNLGNQLLHQYIYTHLMTAGLHPDYGVIHSEIHHDLPLAWDLSAEFFAPIVDDLVLNFVRNLTNSNGNGNGKKHHTILQRFLQHWEGKLKSFVLHPYAGEISYRQCIDLQVKEYIASLLGDVEYYRPLALKFHPNHSIFTNIPEKQKPALTLVK
ncbi:MAG: CRISPR-associated endonuclease Cas1 [Methylacidiphilales bacterium]|nr:CRISPR-associated endonuclease Cas1 [Candidatus Methylacidiphilales bacterium]